MDERERLRQKALKAQQGLLGNAKLTEMLEVIDAFPGEPSPEDILRIAEEFDEAPQVVEIAFEVREARLQAKRKAKLGAIPGKERLEDQVSVVPGEEKALPMPGKELGNPASTGKEGKDDQGRQLSEIKGSLPPRKIPKRGFQRKWLREEDKILIGTLRLNLSQVRKQLRTWIKRINALPVNIERGVVRSRDAVLNRRKVLRKREEKKFRSRQEREAQVLRKRINLTDGKKGRGKGAEMKLLYISLFHPCVRPACEVSLSDYKLEYSTFTAYGTVCWLGKVCSQKKTT